MHVKTYHTTKQSTAVTDKILHLYKFIIVANVWSFVAAIMSGRSTRIVHDKIIHQSASTFLPDVPALFFWSSLFLATTILLPFNTELKSVWTLPCYLHLWKDWWNCKLWWTVWKSMNWIIDTSQPMQQLWKTPLCLTVFEQCQQLCSESYLSRSHSHNTYKQTSNQLPVDIETIV